MMTETETLCVSCHFDEEEKLVLPHLPWWHKTLLLREHASLRKRGYPAIDMLGHAESEMATFQKYCPDDVVAALDRQHARLIPILKAQLL